MKAALAPVFLAACILILLAVFAPAALAQSGGPYELTWTTIAAGGGTLAGGAYGLVSSIGQAEAGPAMSGGSYSLTGGVWGLSAAAPPPGSKRAYLPLIVR